MTETLSKAVNDVDVSLRDASKRTRRNAYGAILAATAAVTIAASSMVSTPSFALPRYDGLWSVSVVTKKGACDPGYRYPVRITNGTLFNAGDTTFTVTGKVRSTGAITVTVSAAGKSATGSGRLAGDAGGGSWTGGSCSGTWTAERRGS